MTNSESVRVRDPLDQALSATFGRLRRHARWRLALYAWFAAMTAASLWLLAPVVLGARGTGMAAVWPALLPQVAAVAVLVWGLRLQLARAAALRQRALPVATALAAQVTDIDRCRRESQVLLLLAALSVPALLWAVARLADTPALDGPAARWLAILVVLPGLVIAGVHGSRLRRLRRERAQVRALLEDLRGPMQALEH